MDTLTQSHRIKTTLTQDGTLTLDHLPFQAGEAVEVVIVPNAPASPMTDPYPLRGIPIRCERPLEPVAEED
jgi:hypothetical protein